MYIVQYKEGMITTIKILENMMAISDLHVYNIRNRKKLK